MPEKTRDPQADLYHYDYLPWIDDVDDYLVEHAGDSEYPAALHAQLTPLIPPLEVSIHEYQTAKDHEDGASTDYTAGFDALIAKMRLVRNLLPTIIDDPSAPAEFSLKDKLPTDRDDLFVRAQACVNNWNEVCDPDVPPEYTPLAAHFDEIADLFSEYSTLKDSYSAAYYAMTDAQNTLLEKRAACHEVERNIFNWFRGFHPSGKDQFWTETPWGSTGESGGSEQLPAVTGLGLDYLDPQLRVYWDAVEGADGYKLKMGGNPTLLTTTLYVGPDTEYSFDPPGGHHYFRVWAMDGDEMGERGDYVEIEIEGTPPGPPLNLNMTLDADGNLRIEWEMPESGVPDYCNLYLTKLDSGSPSRVPFSAPIDFEV